MAMHDNKAKIAKFKHRFNGDVRDTIRFMFAIRDRESITQYQATLVHIYKDSSQNTKMILSKKR